MLTAPANESPRPGTRIFYGWFIVASAGLVVFSTGPGQSYVFSVFVDSIIADTGLSRIGVSVLYMASTALSALLVTVVSRLADRYGPRMMLAAAGFGLGAACFGMATATHILLFFVAFASLRALGQGSLSINCVLLVNQWFVSKRGRAAALMTMGAVVSTALFPPFARFLIDNLDWRGAYAVLGVLVIGLIVPAAILVVRNRPEDMGLFPDGSDSPPVSEAGRSTPEAPRRANVYRSPGFWLLALALSTPSLVSTALVFHQASIFQENGLSATVAAGVFAIYSVSSAVSSLVAGFVVDRIGPNGLAVFSMATLLATVVLAVVMDSLFLAVIYVAMMGISAGSYIIVMNTIWAWRYGRHGLGRIQGPAMTLSLCASAVGPSAARGLQGTHRGLHPGHAPDDGFPCPLHRRPPPDPRRHRHPAIREASGCSQTIGGLSQPGHCLNGHTVSLFTCPARTGLLEITPPRASRWVRRFLALGNPGQSPALC